MHDIVDQVAGIVSQTEEPQNPALPSGDGLDSHQAHVGVGLEAGVVERHGHAGAERDTDGNHEALHVDSVAHMGRSTSGMAGREEKGIDRLVERIEALILRAGLHMGVKPVEEFAQEFHGRSVVIRRLRWW